MKVTSVAVLAVISGAALAQSSLEHHHHHHHGNHFGNVLVSQASAVSDAKVFINDHQQNIISPDAASTTLKAVNFADITNRAFGLSPVNPSFDAPSVMVDTNTLAKASLTFTLPNVSGNDVSFEGVAMDLTSQWTASSLSFFNTATRGVEADRHGITGCSIPRPTTEDPTVTVPAFSATALPRVPSSSAQLTAAFPKSTVICASSSEKWAYCDGGKTVNVTTEVPYAKAIEILGLTAVDGYVQIGQALVSLDDAAPLLSELAYARTLAASISDAIITDASPDAYSVIFAGLKRLSATDRAQALPLVTATIAEASAAMQKRYDGILTSVIATGTPSAVNTDASVALITEVANEIHAAREKRHEARRAHNHEHKEHKGRKHGHEGRQPRSVVVSAAAFPTVVASPVRSLCTRANELAVARELDLTFKCISAPRQHRHHGRDFVSGVFLEDQVSVTATTTTVTTDDIRKYQIVLWGVLTLIAVLYYGVYSTMYMDIYQDPSLFGNLSPTWTKRS